MVAEIGLRGPFRNWTSKLAKGKVGATDHIPTEKSMSLGSEFKAFIARGNVMDLAVGVIIGGAFATITKIGRAHV